MNMKELRKIHRDKFTRQVEIEVKKDEFIREREPRPGIDYISFKVWLRGYETTVTGADIGETTFTGKALKIRQGA